MGITTSEFVVVVGRDLLRLLKLIKELKGEVIYSDTTSNFVRLRFRGSPCSSGYVDNVIKFVTESRDLINSCKCLSTYTNRLRVSGSANKELTMIKSCVSKCVTVSNKVLCGKRVEGINLTLEILVNTYSLKLRAYPTSIEEVTQALSSLRQAVSCDESLIRKLLSIMCEIEKCLSEV